VALVLKKYNVWPARPVPVPPQKCSSATTKMQQSTDKGYLLQIHLVLT